MRAQHPPLRPHFLSSARHTLTLPQLLPSLSHVLGVCGDLAWAKGEGKDHTDVLLLVLLSASALLPLLHRPAFLATDFQPALTHYGTHSLSFDLTFITFWISGSKPK